MAILGQKGSATGIPNISFMASTTWTPACNYEAYVYVIGGGGSGSGSVSNSDVSCTGGSAGGCVISKLTLVSGTEYTIVVGSGGEESNIQSQTYGPGNAGGASSFAGSGITTMNAGGGGAGKVWRDGSWGLTSDYGPANAGGTASGGNIANFVGGLGGETTAIRTCTGGGAVGLWQNGRSPSEKAIGSDGYDSAMGGNLSLYTRSDQDADADWGQAEEQAPVALAPFPELFTWKHDYAYSYISSDHLGDTDHTMFAGLQYLGPNNSGDVSSSGAGDGQRIFTVAPFMGGNGFCSQDSAMSRGSQGCLGSGSGAVFVSSGHTNCRTGAGGDGAVLIFPTSMG